MDKLRFTLMLAAALLAACHAPTDPAPTPAPRPAAAATLNPVATASEPAAARPGGHSGEEDRRVNQTIDRVLGDHRRYQPVIEQYQRAVAANDRAAVAALVRYPLAATLQGGKVSIADAGAFLAHYERILTPDIVRAVASQRYSQLMVSGQGVMFGRGETWIGGICKPGSQDCSDFEVKVIAIQPGRVP